MSDFQSILEKYKLKGPYLQDEYVQHVESKFKKLGTKFLELVDESLEKGFSGDAWERIYQLKNKDPELSLYISSHCYTVIYAEILNYLSRSTLKPKKSFIEIGCENGLLTMCLSDFWGIDQAIGIDRVNTAINAAKKLAIRFRKFDIFFHKADLFLASSCKNIGKSDFLIAPFFFHEMLDSSEKNWLNTLNNLDYLLEEHGLLLTINRFPYPDVAEPKLSDKLSEINLKLIKSESMNVLHETFPIYLYQR